MVEVKEMFKNKMFGRVNNVYIDIRNGQWKCNLASCHQHPLSILHTGELVFYAMMSILS